MAQTAVKSPLILSALVILVSCLERNSYRAFDYSALKGADNVIAQYDEETVKTLPKCSKLESTHMVCDPFSEISPCLACRLKQGFRIPMTTSRIFDNACPPPTSFPAEVRQSVKWQMFPEKIGPYALCFVVKGHSEQEQSNETEPGTMQTIFSGLLGGTAHKQAYDGSHKIEEVEHQNQRPAQTIGGPSPGTTVVQSTMAENPVQQSHSPNVGHTADSTRDYAIMAGIAGGIILVIAIVIMAKK